MVLSFPAGIYFQKADTQPSGLYRYSLGIPNQPKHKSPPNGLTDFLRGFTSRKVGSQGGNVNDPAFSDYTSKFCLVHEGNLRQGK